MLGGVLPPVRSHVAQLPGGAGCQVGQRRAVAVGEELCLAA